MTDLAEFDFEESTHELAAAKASAPSLIEDFGIRRLHGYRTISLSSEYAATIIIAKNGTGKTTLLAVMDAFLKRQYSRFRNLDFSEIFCKLRGYDEIVLTHDDLLSLLELPTRGDFLRLANRTSLAPETLFDFLLSDFEHLLEDLYGDGDGDPAVMKIAQAYQFDILRAVTACKDAYAQIIERSPRLAHINAVLMEAVGMYEILYLPTYRRVELALTDEESNRLGRRKKRPKISVSAGSLHIGNIQFGLSDIAERLEQLNREIAHQANNGYRQISENMINELIRGYEVTDSDNIPTLDDLKLFFSRVETNEFRLGSFYPPISPPEYEKIYKENGVPSENRRFLLYFLGKLAQVIKATEDIVRPVEQFVSRCNKYLSSPDLSTLSPDEADHQHLEQIDSKKLLLDITDLSVTVLSLPHDTPITLDALSSGEKQMISLFAKLYLYPKKKIVLIDEPELSLSLDWQREILIDVLLSPQCEQVMAITHSPFVFDNSLEPFARSISLKVEPMPKRGSAKNALIGPELFNSL